MSSYNTGFRAGIEAAAKVCDFCRTVNGIKAVILALTPPDQEQPVGEEISFTYTNWRGETAVRTVVPIRLFWGSSEWHPEAQWLLRGHDLSKSTYRDFALKDCQFTTSSSPTASDVPLPEKIMVWAPSPETPWLGTWATTRYPDDAVAYVPASVSVSEAAERVDALEQVLEWQAGVIRKNLTENGIDKHRLLLDGVYHEGPVVDWIQQVLAGFEKINQSILHGSLSVAQVAKLLLALNALAAEPPS